ncbi:MAG: DUF2855 family protein [Actinomycetota bacterium]|nr:DUF2855 family protein [Actinomycetota bacterium]
MPEAARWELLVSRDDLVVTEVRQLAVPALAADQVELAVERLALTTNNVTYAHFGGPPMNFWNTFPTADSAWGRLPVWGFARVTRSRHPGFSPGERFFGLVPSASHHLVVPAAAARGFADATPDRHFPHPWYGTFQPAGVPDHHDDRRALLRPVYPASFHAADALAAKAGDDGLTVLVTSASSKVAIGIAHRLRGNPNVRTVGLTSADHREFVTGLGLYGQVVSYQDLAALTVEGPVACVDLSGDNALMAVVHGAFQDRLAHFMTLGWTRGVQPPPDLTDPVPERLFAPGVEATAIEAEGVDAYFARYLAAEDEFIASTESWLTVKNDGGPDAVAAVFRGLVDGSHPVDRCTVITP